MAEEELNRLKKGMPVKGYINVSCIDLVNLLIECIQSVNIED